MYIKDIGTVLGWSHMSYGFFAALMVQCATFYSFYYCTLNCILNLNGTLRRLLRAAECFPALVVYRPTPLLLLYANINMFECVLLMQL